MVEFDRTHDLYFRTCKIGTNTLIGPSAKISENVQVISSVIGQNCSIGAGTIIDNSYIFDNTIIGPNCKIQRSIVGSGCTIKENTLVQNGSLIGDGVIIGPDVMLSPFERLSLKRSSIALTQTAQDSDEEDSDLEVVEESEALIMLFIIHGKLTLLCALRSRINKREPQLGKGLECSHVAQGTT